MFVYVVTETVQYDYDDQTYTNVYGVYLLEAMAEAAVIECEAQVGGKYYATIEKHFVE